MDLKTQLQAILEGDILNDPQTLENFSQDASIFQVKPQLVITPKNSSDISKLIKFATLSANSPQPLSVTARSAGTDMSGGPLSDSIVLDMTKYFNQVLGFSGQKVTTQPGVYYRDFEPLTLQKNLLLPCYTASRELNTVGGMVANNSAGEKTLTYGQTERYVKSLKAVLSDGNEYLIKPISKGELGQKIIKKTFEGRLYKQIYELVTQNSVLISQHTPQVSKNSAGYLLWKVWDGTTFDLTKLLIGSQGTLGIITEITFELIPPTTHSKLLVIFMNDLDNLGHIINKVLEGSPESFESYDDYTLKIATRYLPEVLKVMKVKNLISLALGFIPEIIMALTHGFPKLVLIAEFTGNSQDEVTQKAKTAQQSLQEFNLKTRLTSSESDAKKYWTLRRESFNLLRKHSNNLRTAPFIDDIVVKPEYLEKFLPKLRKILDEYKLIYTVAGHIGNGNFHIIPLMDFHQPQTREIIPELSERVYDLVFSYQGSMTGEHNDGLVRGPYLEKMFGKDMYQLFKQVKSIFDPNNIFNPHKKIDATFQYSYSHIVSEHSTLHPIGS